MVDVERPRRLRTERQPPATCPPGWVWFLSGMLIGMFISFLVYLQEVVPSRPQSSQTAPVPTVVAASPPAPAPPQPHKEEKQIEPPKPVKPVDTSGKFEFYDKLPNPEEEKAQPVQTLSDKTGTLVLPAVLQVGAFRDEQAAQGLKTHLSTLGVRAYVEQSMTGNEMWYRVRVGPISSVGQYNQLVVQLNEHNITANVLPITR